MSGNPAHPEVKMLPGAGGAEASSLPATTTGVIGGTPPSRQLFEMPREELEHLADEYGLDPTTYKYRQHLVAAIHERRQLIVG